MTDNYNYLGNTNARLELLGIPNILNPFSQFNSASRVSMFNHHLSQTMVLDNPEFNPIFTGVEEKLIDYTFNRSRREHDCEIIAIIPKYDANILPITSDDCPQYYVVVATLEPDGKRHLDYFEINRYFMGANKFGFLPILENIHRIKPGEFLGKETVITRSPAVQENMYCMGTPLNVIYGSFPETIEDAFIISKSAAEKLQTTEVSQVVINCRQDRRPLNLYGDSVTEKFLPDIGSYVRDDGALCAFRPVHWTTTVADSDPDTLREVLPLQDDPYYINPGAKIVDITFNINRHKLNNCYLQAEQYARSNNTCWQRIYEVYLKYKDKYRLTQEMSTLVKTAIFRMIAYGYKPPTFSGDFGKLMRNFEIEGYGRQTVDFLQAIVTYTVPRKVNNGDKITDLHGGKGVVGRIYPDEWMPVDEDGFRADLWVDMNSPVGRNNPGQLYETGLGRITMFAQRKIKETLDAHGSEAAFEVLMDLYNDVNPNFEKRTREVAVHPEQRAGLVRDAVDRRIVLWVPPFLETLTPSDENFWNALENMKKWQLKWGARSSRVTYRSLQADGTGKEFTTRHTFAIGPKYILHLHKIPEIFAPGPASVNHIGIPTKSMYESKHFPVSNNPYRYGEDELRIMSMDTDIREITRFQNMMSNSPLGVNTVIQTLLLCDDPTRIKRMPISNGELARSSAVLKLFHNITAVLGVQTKTTKNDEYTSELQRILDTSNDIADSIYATDIVDEKSNPISMFDDDEGVTKRARTKRGKLDTAIAAIGNAESEDA